MLRMGPGSVVSVLGLSLISGCGIFPPTGRAVDTETQTLDMPAGAALMVTNDTGMTQVSIDPAATQATIEVTRRAFSTSVQAATDLLDAITVSVKPPSAANNNT